MARSTKTLVPKQVVGAKSNVSHSVSLSGHKDAEILFRSARKRLLKVSDWRRISEGFSADFKLLDSSGQELRRPARKGDYFRIDIPFPGTRNGNGYDWVQIEAIEEDRDQNSETIAIRVRPSANPNDAGKDTAHFFDEDASSTFLVRREHNTVYAAVYGRNEKPNTALQSIIDRIRNVLVAAGAMLGLSKPQWKGLVRGLLSKPVSEL